MSIINPNAPVAVDEMIPAQGYNGGVITSTGWTDLSHRTRGSQSATHGKTYELDQVRAGQLTTQWLNTDGAFDPANGASPFAPLLPYRPFRRRLQWPPTANLLTADQATGGEGTPLAAGTLATAAGLYSDYDSSAQVAASASAWQGGQVWQALVGAAAAAGGTLLGVAAVSWQAASTGSAVYTQSLRARCTTAGASPSVHAEIRAMTAAGLLVSAAVSAPQTLTGSAAAVWSGFTVTATPPAGALWCELVLVADTLPAGGCTIQVDGWQFERAASASTFAVPGRWYSQFSGWVERFPQSWTMGGTYGTTAPVVVDSFAFFSQVTLQDPFIQQVLLLTPTFAYLLNDPAGSTTCLDITGMCQPAPIGISPAGQGSLTLGDSVSPASAALGIAGYTGTVATLANNPTFSNVRSYPQTYIDLSTNRTPGPPTSGPWTRMLAFCVTTAPTGSQTYTLWRAGPATYSNIRSLFAIEITAGGFLSVMLDNIVGFQTGYTGTTNLCDGNWHLVTVSSGTGTSLQVSVDGAVVGTTSGPTITYPLGCDSDAVGCTIELGVNLFITGLVGQLAHVIELPSFLTGTQIATLYAGWRLGFAGDSTGTRYARILTWCGWAGPTSIDPGSTTNMGPATDITGIDGLSALQAVCDTENGNHYISRTGLPSFRGRSARYNQATPAVVFGEDVAAGEYPYEDLSFDFDTSRLATQAQITQYSTSQIFQWPPAGSAAQDEYGTFTLERTVNSADPNECIAAAQYLVGQNQQPRLRIEAISLHPSAQPALWPVLLPMELGTRARAMRRPPPPAPAIAFDGFVEQIAPTWDDTADATYALQISPADLAQYWLLAALHGSLHTTAAAGQTTITCNPLPDAATNPFRGSLPPGTQVTLDPGTSIAETLTVATVAATSPGYTSATVTFTSTLAHAHTAGAEWCEALPAGDTDPTMWDPLSLLGSSTVLTY